MADLPGAAVQAAESAIRDAVRIRLGPNALAQARQGEPLMLSGTEAEQAARAALEAAAPLIAAQARTEERAAIARMVRSHFAAVDDPLYEDVRILCERIERGEHLPAAEPTTPPKPAPGMRCSECGRPLVGQPCGLVHAVARMQIAAIRTGLSSLLKGGGHA